MRGMLNGEILRTECRLLTDGFGLIGDGDLLSTVLLVISQEGIEDTTGILAHSSLRVHIVLLIPRGDEAKLYQTAWHGRQTEHSEVILLGTHVLTPCGLTDIALHIFRQFHTVLHVLVLNELEHDIALRRIGVVALISLFVVLLKQDDGVLTLGHFQILIHTVPLSRALALAQGIRLEPSGNAASGHSVDMNGYEEVGLVVVRNLSTTIELHETVRLSGVDHLHVRTVALYHLSEGEAELQRQVLLLRDGTDGTGV